MHNFMIGTVLQRSVTFDYGKTFFYAMNGNRKVLVILDDHVTLPEDLSGSFEFRGVFGFSNKNRVLKLKAASMIQIPASRNPRDELRQLMNGLRKRLPVG